MKSIWVLISVVCVSFVLTSCSSTDNDTDLLNQAISSRPNKKVPTATSNASANNDSDVLEASLDPPATVISHSQSTAPAKTAHLKVVKIKKITPLNNSNQKTTIPRATKTATVVTTAGSALEAHKYMLINVPPKHTANDIKTWKIYLGDRVISNTLERWAEEGGYQLVWKTQHDFEITSEAVVTGNIRYAFNQVLLSFLHTSSPIKATWYKNKVIVITSFGD